MLFYHFSLQEFDSVSDLGSGKISFFLDMPTENAIERLRVNGFKSWGKLRQPYWIYVVDLEKYKDDIHRYLLTSIPEEWEYREQEDNDWTEEDKINHLLFNGIRVRYNNYYRFVKGIKKNWLGFNHYALQQIKMCKEFNKYYNLYAAFIPHVIVSCKKDLTIKPVSILKGDDRK